MGVIAYKDEFYAGSVEKIDYIPDVSNQVTLSEGQNYVAPTDGYLSIDMGYSVSGYYYAFLKYNDVSFGRIFSGNKAANSIGVGDTVFVKKGVLINMNHLATGATAYFTPNAND